MANDDITRLAEAAEKARKRNRMEGYAEFHAIARPAAILSLLQRLREAEEALKPFAKAGQLFPPREPTDFNMCIYAPAAGKEYNITADDLRRARAHMEKHHER